MRRKCSLPGLTNHALTHVLFRTPIVIGMALCDAMFNYENPNYFSGALGHWGTGGLGGVGSNPVAPTNSFKDLEEIEAD